MGGKPRQQPYDGDATPKLAKKSVGVSTLAGGVGVPEPAPVLPAVPNFKVPEVDGPREMGDGAAMDLGAKRTGLTPLLTPSSVDAAAFSLLSASRLALPPLPARARRAGGLLVLTVSASSHESPQSPAALEVPPALLLPALGRDGDPAVLPLLPYAVAPEEVGRCWCAGAENPVASRAELARDHKSAIETGAKQGGD